MTPATGREWRIDLGARPPLWLNGQRRHWKAHAREVKHWRRLSGWATRQAGVPALERVAIELHYVPRIRRRRDPLNLVATLKPVEDGIVDAGVIPDDTPQYSVPTVPVIHEAEPGETSWVYVIIREVAPCS